MASMTSDATVCWLCPGNEEMGTGSLIPSRTKSGAMRSSTVTDVSATRRRRAGVRRRRRRRRTGNAAVGGVHDVGVSTVTSVPAPYGGVGVPGTDPPSTGRELPS